MFYKISQRGQMCFHKLYRQKTQVPHLSSTLTILLPNTRSFTAAQYNHYVIMASRICNYLVHDAFLTHPQSCETGVSLIHRRALLL